MNARRDGSSPIFLVGFMAVGKSTAGRALAQRLGWGFEDTDVIVELAEGRTIETIFREAGEGRFREAEWNALLSLRGRREVVVATGGGLFLGAAQRAFLRAEGISCWLDAPLEALEGRLDGSAPRPVWPAADSLARRALFERRRAAYALADCRVAAAGIAADDLATAIDAARRLFLR